jgi:hypothetical protein
VTNKGIIWSEESQLLNNFKSALESMEVNLVSIQNHFPGKSWNTSIYESFKGL